METPLLLEDHFFKPKKSVSRGVAVLHISLTQLLQVKVVEHQKQKASSAVAAKQQDGAVAGGGSGKGDGLQTDFFEKHIALVKKKLQSAQGQYKTCLQKELLRTEQKAREFKLKGKTSVDLQKALLQEEQRRLEMMRELMRKLASIGKCPMEFSWIWKPSEGHFRCAGGSHTATPERLGVTASDCSRYFGDTGVMKLD